MKNGYIMPYYLYSGGHVQFAKRAGLIPAAQRLDEMCIRDSPRAGL